MQGIVVPVSLMEEEKEFLGLMSIRQVLILGPTIFCIYTWITVFPIPYIPVGTKVLIKLAGSLFIGGVSSIMAFFYLDKYEMYFDRYLWVRFKYLQSHKEYHYNLTRN